MRLDRRTAMQIGNSEVRYNFTEILIAPKSQIENDYVDLIKMQYEQSFKEFIATANNANVEVVVLWIPTDTTKSVNTTYKTFFADLSVKNQVSFVSVDKLRDLPREDVFLRPYSGHLTRYANRIIAESLEKYINSYKLSPKNAFICDEIRGHYKPNAQSLITVMSEVPYRLSSDQFGFRKTQKAKYDPSNPVIMIVGDSFTFGPYLPFFDTYPAILSRKLISVNVINAGVPSFSIRSELQIMKQNIKCLNPNLIVLQVLDNDLNGMSATKYNLYNFGRDKIKMSDEESRFLESLRVNN